MTCIPKNIPHTTYSDKGRKSKWSYLFFDPGRMFGGWMPGSWENINLVTSRNKRVSIHIKKRRLRTNLQPCNAGDFRDDREKARLPAEHPRPAAVPVYRTVSDPEPESFPESFPNRRRKQVQYHGALTRTRLYRTKLHGILYDRYSCRTMPLEPHPFQKSILPDHGDVPLGIHQPGTDCRSMQHAVYHRRLHPEHLRKHRIWFRIQLQPQLPADRKNVPKRIPHTNSRHPPKLQWVDAAGGVRLGA